MLNLKIAGASLLLGASTVALAQEEDSVTTGIGTEISGMAEQGMPTTDPAAFAAEVQALAKAQRPENAGDEDDDVDEEDDVEGENQGIGAAVSAEAQLQKDAEDKTAFGAWVVGQTPAADRAATGLSTAADARAAASANRADVTQVRSTATAARAEAQAAAATARNIRDTVRAARPGRPGN